MALASPNSVCKSTLKGVFYFYSANHFNVQQCILRNKGDNFELIQLVDGNEKYFTPLSKQDMRQTTSKVFLLKPKWRGKAKF